MDSNSTVNKIYNDPNNNINVKIQEGPYTNYSNRYIYRLMMPRIIKVIY